MNLCYYITSHGYGHGVRTAAICNELSPGITLFIKTSLPESFLREEIQRPFTYLPAEFDCGCVQKDGITVDIPETIKTYSRIAERNQTLLADESRWLKKNKIDGVIADTTPFAFEAASIARIPSILITNFTWYDIYREYAIRYPEFIPVVEQIKKQYGMAGIYFALDRTVDTSYVKAVKNMPVTGRKGVNVRDKIITCYQLDSGKKIGLIYTGNYGMDSADWKKLGQLEEWEFLGVYQLPVSLKNFHLISKKHFRYQDLSASVDCVISKIGYGTFSESIIHGVPLMYVPREDFSEFPVLEARLKEWGHAYRISPDDFYRLNWADVLEKVDKTARPQPYSINGAQECARELERFINAV
jgi:hypothetical protein